MANLAQTLLTNLHSALSGIGGYILLAPKDAEYPLLTYTILNSKISPIKSFTSEGEVFTVQFSYFDDTSILNCLSLNTSAVSAIESLSAYFDISKGNFTTIGNTEQHKYYQLIDTREIEILEDLIPVVPPAPVTYTVEYFGNGNDSGTAPIDVSSPYVSGSTVTVLGNSGNLAKSGYTFNDWNSLSAGTGTDYASGSTFTINSNTNLFAKWIVVAPINYVFTGTDLNAPENYTPNGIPTSIDNVEITSNIPGAIQLTGTLTCAALTLDSVDGAAFDFSQVTLLDIDSLTVMGTAGLIYSTIPGITVTFNDSAYCYYVTLDSATFNDTSYASEGSYITYAAFNDNSYNESTTIQSADFYNSSINKSAGAINIIGTFRNTSDNQGGCYQADFIPNFDTDLEMWIYPTNTTGTGDTANCYWDQIDHDLDNSAGFTTVNYLGYPS